MVALAGVGAALGASASLATGATTVTGFDESRFIRLGGELQIVDANNVRNDLTVEPRNYKLAVRERGPAPLEAQEDCGQRSAKFVTCDLGVVDYIGLDLRGGSDRALVRADPDIQTYIFESGGSGRDGLQAINGETAELDGGSGDDILIGDSSDDALYGGSGSDRLYGRSGDDVLNGDAFDTSSATVRPANDLLDGGRGRDTASWEGSPGPVHVDLRAHRGGGRGEHDTLRSIESVIGTDGPDHLIGDRVPNHLVGGKGADLIHGGGGTDTIDGGRDGVRDTIDCGSGRDLVAGLERAAPEASQDPIPQDCELLSIDGFQVGTPRLRLGSSRVAVEATCPAYDHCRRHVVLTSRGRELGRSGAADFRRTKTFTVRLQHPLASRGAPIEVAIDGLNVDFNGSGGTSKGTFSYLLVRPRR